MIVEPRLEALLLVLWFLGFDQVADQRDLDEHERDHAEVDHQEQIGDDGVFAVGDVVEPNEVLVS